MSIQLDNFFDYDFGISSSNLFDYDLDDFLSIASGYVSGYFSIISLGDSLTDSLNITSSLSFDDVSGFFSRNQKEHAF